MEKYTPTKEGNSWVITPKAEGWVFDRTYPTRWKANLALTTWLQGGRVSDYFAAAREEKAARKARAAERREDGTTSKEGTKVGQGSAMPVGEMTPSYEELCALNPRLAQRSRQDTEALVQAVRDCGYVWDSSKQLFFHPELSASVRTEGLDIFTAERFREAHRSQSTIPPESRRLMASSQRATGCGCQVLGVAILWAISGWLVTDWQNWLIGLAILLASFGVLYGLGLVDAKRAGQIQRGEP